MRSKKASLLKIPFFLTPILFLALIFTSQVAVNAASTVTFGENTIAHNDILGGDDYTATTEDSKIYSDENSSNNNYGSAPDLQAGCTNKTTRNWRTLIRFKHIGTKIEPDRTITSATLYLYCNDEENDTDRNVEVYGVLLNWGEGSANGNSESGAVCWNYYQHDTLPWNLAGCDHCGNDRTCPAQNTTPITGSGVWFSWEVTTAVQSWHSGGWEEHGLVLINAVENDKFTRKAFCSSEGPNGFRPYLKVTYEEGTHYVDDDACEGNRPCYASIQTAIDAANENDTVIVYAGTYNEITMADGVDVENYSNDVPVIDSNGTNPAVTFNGEFSTGCTLDGFKVTNGGNNGGIYLKGTGDEGIGNSTVIKNCDIYGNANGPGIKLGGGTAVTGPTIDNNDIHDNTDQEGIHIEDAAGSLSKHVIIKNNDIYGHNKAGINIGGNSYVTIGGNNNIYSNYAGIAFDTANPSSQPITIMGNDIYLNTSEGGIVIKDAVSNTETITITENNIEQNTMGGIEIRNSCKLEITKNRIHSNIRGGIHTGTDVANDFFSDLYGFIGDPGSAVLTIRQNKIHNNGGSNYGAGIDVRHASGTIYNNLVYDNNRGGMRFGAYITEIISNTVVGNGQNDRGGGIIFDDLAGEVNDQPEGALPDQLVIRNNISAYNETAGLRVGNMPTGATDCPDNPPHPDDGLNYRDYNLLYMNNGTTYHCKWDATYPDRQCVNKNYGGCGLDDNWNKISPNDIIADPMFVDGYHPDGVDMGAYGGGSPLVDEEIPDPINIP